MSLFSPSYQKISVSYGASSADDQAGTRPMGKAREPLSGHKAEQNDHSEFWSGQRAAPFPRAAHDSILRRGDPVPAYDPHSVHREFPRRWQTYIRANFADPDHVRQVFGVSDRTARKWWAGQTGANGGHVAIAVAEHPVAATRMLFAAE